MGEESTKERKSARFTVRLSDSELAQLQAVRQGGVRTLSEVVRVLIKQHLRAPRER